MENTQALVSLVIESHQFSVFGKLDDNMCHVMNLNFFTFHKDFLFRFQDLDQNSFATLVVDAFIWHFRKSVFVRCCLYNFFLTFWHNMPTNIDYHVFLIRNELCRTVVEASEVKLDSISIDENFSHVRTRLYLSFLLFFEHRFSISSSSGLFLQALFFDSFFNIFINIETLSH
tara:strand:+ start:35 stop:553 length:519 start_codon:yes stop_codon:yes gene_type:complete